MIVFRANRLYTPQDEIQDALLFVEDGRIAAVSSGAHREIPGNATVVDLTLHFPDNIVVPGFVDIHVHGGNGVDLMRAGPSEFARLNHFHAAHGVTGYFATTVAAPMDETCRALDRLAAAIESAQDSASGMEAPAQAMPLGIHLEGPFLSHQRRGVHPPEYLVEPAPQIFDRLWQAARGQVRMMTIAPELPGALETIAEAVRHKVCVSIGHSDASLGEARAGVLAGARHATHTFNAMRPLDHREPGILGEVLADDNISADMIVDGIHIAPEVVKLFLRAKGIERSVLITDATAAAGMPDGRYQLGPIEVTVKDGKCTMDGKLAGSVLTMDRAVRNVTQFSGWNLRDAVRAATLNATRAVGLEHHGQLVPGAEANIVVLSLEGEVRKTIIRGRGL
ncbi:MAG: N-acetylglucosamine-6-phosphate deacetylase [Candidatus Sulfotelmatobacter sp.]